MQVKVEALAGPALDWALSKCEDPEITDADFASSYGGPDWNWCYVQDKKQALELLRKAGIFLSKRATQDQRIAAMRGYVASKFGAAIEVSDEISALD